MNTKKKAMIGLSFAACMLLAACGNGTTDSTSAESSTAESSTAESSVSSAAAAHLLLVDIDESLASYTVSGESDSNGLYVEGTEITVYIEVIEATKAISRIISDDVDFDVLENNGGDGYVSFIMPDSNVLLEVQCNATRVYEVEMLRNFYPSYVTGFNIEEGETFPCGSTVDFQVYCSEAILPEYLYYTVNGVTASPAAVTDGGDKYVYKCSFEMPAENISIFVTAAGNVETSSGYKVTFENDDHITWLAPISGQYLSTVAVYGVLYKTPGTVVESIQYQYEGSDTWHEASFRCYAGCANCLYTHVYYPEGNFTFRVNYTTADVYSINLHNDDCIETYTSSYYDDEVAEGETIMIYYTTVDGTYITEAATIEGVAEENISLNTYSPNALSVGIKFIMPANDVDITFHTGDKIDLSADTDNRLSIQVCFATTTTRLFSGSYITQGAPGSRLIIAARPISPYYITSFNVNGTNLEAVYYEAYDCYYVETTCPDVDTHVYANIEEGYVATTDIDSTYASVVYESTYTSRVYASGDTGTFIIVPNEGYVLNTSSVVLKDAGGNTISYTEVERDDGYYSGTFVMPSSNVTLSAEFYTEVTLSLDIDSSYSSYINSVSIVGKTTNSQLTLTNTSAVFYADETLSITITHSTSYTIKVYEVLSGGTENQLADTFSSVNGYFSNTTTQVSASASSIKIVLEAVE